MGKLYQVIHKFRKINKILQYELPGQQQLIYLKAAPYPFNLVFDEFFNDRLIAIANGNGV